MRKKMVWFITAGVAVGLCASAEVVITSPAGLTDESDVVLEVAVDAVRQTPADTVKAGSDIALYANDELRNTVHGAKAAVAGDSVREKVKNSMVQEVEAAWDNSGKIEMRTYEVGRDIGQEMVQDSGSTVSVLDVSKFFMGVDFPEGTSAYYRPEFKRLIVHQTTANLPAINAIMARYQKSAPVYKQIEIETKFIEVSQHTLNELGFSWDFYENPNQGGTWVADLMGQTLDKTLRSSAAALNSGVPAGALTLIKGGGSPMDLTITALEQASDSDVLSAPRVTTHDGSTAKIWVGDQEMMPTEIRAGSEQTSVFVEYGGWQKKNIGVYLEVKPEVQTNGTINLDLKPEVIDLLGYDTYQITPNNGNMLVWAGYSAYYNSMSGRYPIPNNPGADTAWNSLNATLSGTPGAVSADPNYTSAAGNNAYGYFDTKRAGTHEDFGVPVPTLNGQLPYFRVRTIQTKLTVADGSTVGMGGLIYDKMETYKDKVPVLGSIPLIGRLFRSEGERSVKRNLMIFVKATQVDVDGNRKSDLVLD